MLTQQLVNGQMIINTIARYSINESSHYAEPFEPCFDAYEQFIFISTPIPAKVNPSFDLYDQLISIT